MKRLAGSAELLDGKLDARVLRANLRDLARVNRWLGGTSLSWRALHPLLSADSPRSVLDIGTGGADIPIALGEAARRSGTVLHLVATDVRPEIVAVARAAAAGAADVEVRLAARDRIDAPDQSFDVVHASLVVHHLEPAAAVELLREMARVARRAVIINDLDRAAQWWVAAWLLAHVGTLNRYTRHDAPLSVRRAYRPHEMVAMAGRAGLREVARHSARPPYRYAIVFDPAGRRDA